MEKMSHSQNSIAWKFGIADLYPTVNTTVTDCVILFPRKTKQRSISEISYIFLKRDQIQGSGAKLETLGKLEKCTPLTSVS